jgi:tRNA(Ile)-lysidine synthase
MTASFEAAAAAFAPRMPLAIAYSGGADSTALLVACASRWPGQVLAIHVNHGLHAAAADFEKHCEAACAALGVRLHTERIDARNSPGESPEDAARRGRYEAIHRAALREGAACVALAQHADDQVETVLLALTRGAGIAGLSGMRPGWERDGVDYRRPLLEVATSEIRMWLQARGIEWVEDPSNASENYTRNRLRARVLPALRDAFPTVLNTFARSARHAAQAQALLDEIGGEDMQRIGTPPEIAQLRALGRARQANALRHWLRTTHEAQASAAQLEELQRQLDACTTRGHDIRLRVGDGFVQRDGARLVFTPSV